MGIRSGSARGSPRPTGSRRDRSTDSRWAARIHRLPPGDEPLAEPWPADRPPPAIRAQPDRASERSSRPRYVRDIAAAWRRSCRAHLESLGPAGDCRDLNRARRGVSTAPHKATQKATHITPQSGAKSVTAPDRPGSHCFVRPSRNPPNAAWLCRSVRANTTTCVLLQWAERDSNPRRHKPADLQSALVGRLSIRPMGCRPARRARPCGAAARDGDCSKDTPCPNPLPSARYLCRNAHGAT